MKIFYSDTHPVPQEIIDLILSNALSHELIEDSSISDLCLEEGRSRIVGQEGIEDYLHLMAMEVKQGWYCPCNKE